MTGVCMFFSFDGVDGVGKTTQLELFCQWLRDRGDEVVTCRDPGGTRLGETIREILLEHSDITIGARSEMLLYMASRAQLVDEVIRPALAQNKTVVSDRFLLANVVYQGHGGGLEVEGLWKVGLVATANLLPDLTFLLDMPAAESVQRIGRQPDRMEARGTEFMERVRQGFLVEADRCEQIVVVDAAQDVQSVHQSICQAAENAISDRRHAQ
ncbi:MAG TPA: dTMP kinase [Pirellulaceae bacterium]|nr:dTMP kinase [Pirellulaceae bacterium]